MKQVMTMVMIAIITLIFTVPKIAEAVEIMDSTGSYKFRWDMTSGSEASDSGTGSNGYKIESSSSEIKTIIPFSFTISDLSIDFGLLIPGSFSRQINTLNVSSGGSGYSVTAFEDRPLTLQSGTAIIPDTNCDSGACSETTAEAWTDTTKYGFGYNMSGDDVPTAFANLNYFKQFADYSQSEASQIVMSANGTGDNRTATVTYQLNIPSTQTAGDYENSIVFIAAPTY